MSPMPISRKLVEPWELILESFIFLIYNFLLNSSFVEKKEEKEVMKRNLNMNYLTTESISTYLKRERKKSQTFIFPNIKTSHSKTYTKCRGNVRLRKTSSTTPIRKKSILENEPPKQKHTRREYHLR